MENIIIKIIGLAVLICYLYFVNNKSNNQDIKFINLCLTWGIPYVIAILANITTNRNINDIPVLASLLISGIVLTSILSHFIKKYDFMDISIFLSPMTLIISSFVSFMYFKQTGFANYNVTLGYVLTGVILVLLIIWDKTMNKTYFFKKDPSHTMINTFS